MVAYINLCVLCELRGPNLPECTFDTEETVYSVRFPDQAWSPKPIYYLQRTSSKDIPLAMPIYNGLKAYVTLHKRVVGPVLGRQWYELCKSNTLSNASFLENSNWFVYSQTSKYWRK